MLLSPCPLSIPTLGLWLLCTLPAPRLLLDRLSARQGDTAMLSCLVPLDATMTCIVFCKDGTYPIQCPGRVQGPFPAATSSRMITTRRTILSPVTPGTCTWMVMQSTNGGLGVEGQGARTGWGHTVISRVKM
ncbi:unnamed protein product [Eretmochelys imbricata]